MSYRKRWRRTQNRTKKNTHSFVKQSSTDERRQSLVLLVFFSLHFVAYFSRFASLDIEMDNKFWVERVQPPKVEWEQSKRLLLFSISFVNENKLMSVSTVDPLLSSFHGHWPQSCAFGGRCECMCAYLKCVSFGGNQQSDGLSSFTLLFFSAYQLRLINGILNVSFGSIVIDGLDIECKCSFEKRLCI